MVDNMQYTPLEQPAATLTDSRRITLGFPGGMKRGERRFPLTPEATELLTERGVGVRIEEGAPAPIHYADAAYIRSGAEITDRTEALRADVVVSLAPLTAAEVGRMRRGTLLLTLEHTVTEHTDMAQALLRQGVMTVALDRVADAQSNAPFADILHEIDGCASIAIASALLTDPVHGKGILLGGVTGLNPCEVTVLGSGMGAIAAAHNALGMGATVRMFDDDLYSLRSAGRVLGHRAIASALHPRTIESAFRTADVVIATPMRAPFVASSAMVDVMKKRVLVFDLNPCPGHVFPSIPLFNLGEIAERDLAATADRACYFSVGCQVPRTAAMALSNALLALAERLLSAQGCAPYSLAELRPGVMTLMGKVAHHDLAARLGVACIDVNLFTSTLS